MRSFIDIKKITCDDYYHIMNLAEKFRYNNDKPLLDKNLAMIFDKPSTRTRVSFEVGINQLGGHAILLRGDEMQLGRGETIADTAGVLSRFVDIIMIRTFSHDTILELAQHADVPVINGLSDSSHPCQIMADLLTLQQHKGDVSNLKIAWVGDANNVCRSWIEAAALLDCEFAIAAPKEYCHIDDDIIAAEQQGNNIMVTSDYRDAVAHADCVITDCFVSMNDKDHQERLKILMPYQVNGDMMALAKKDAIFMHCMPAHRGEEVTAEVIDGPQSVIFDEAENRLHVQKAIMLWCMGY